MDLTRAQRRMLVDLARGAYEDAVPECMGEMDGQAVCPERICYLRRVRIDRGVVILEVQQ